MNDFRNGAEKYEMKLEHLAGSESGGVQKEDGDMAKG